MPKHTIQGDGAVTFEPDWNAPVTCPFCGTWFPSHYAFRVMGGHADTCWVKHVTDPDWWDDRGASTGYGSGNPFADEDDDEAV